MTKQNNENGYTMIETLMYISILIILGGVLAGYAHTVFTRYKTGRVSQQVLELKKSIIHFTAAEEDYTNANLRKMELGNSLPLDMRTGTVGKAEHALGGEVLIGPVSEKLGMQTEDDDPAEDNFMFYIVFDAIPMSACIEILTQGQFYGDGSEMDTLIINNDYAWRFEYSYYSTAGIANLTTLAPVAEGARNAPSIRLNTAQAVSACSQKLNKITWIFS